MNRYRDPLTEYGAAAASLQTQTVGVVLNCIVDRVGNLAADDETTRAFYRLRDSTLYRLSSVGWHLHSVCQSHVQSESQFHRNPKGTDLNKAHLIQAFASDDVLFNLLGLYDYWSNLVGFAFIGTSRKKIGWRGLATSALDKKNPFSSTAIGPMIAEHHKQWALKLQDLRAEIIHYEHLEGKSRYEISWQAGNEAAFEFLSTLPTPISKKLQLQAPARGDLGVDLQLGLIEICKKSIIWLAEATKLACEQLTRHTVRERASQETPSK